MIIKRNRAKLLAALLVLLFSGNQAFRAPSVVAAAILHHQHVNPETVTVFCEVPAGGDCPSTFHLVHGHTTFFLPQVCLGGAECELGLISLAGSAIFADTNYVCYSDQQGTPAYNATITSVAVQNNEVEFEFRNTNSYPIYANTQFIIAFTCAGS